MPTEIIKPTRRGLITGLAALIAAPALVRASSLMPVSVAPVVELYTMSWYQKGATGSLFGVSGRLISESVTSHHNGWERHSRVYELEKRQDGSSRMDFTSPGGEGLWLREGGPISMLQIESEAFSNAFVVQNDE